MARHWLGRARRRGNPRPEVGRRTLWRNTSNFLPTSPLFPQNRLHFNPPWFVSENFARFSFAPLPRASPDRLGGAATALILTWHLPYSRTMPPAGHFRPLIS